ncbi:MAG: PAS domain-containing protein [Gemmatimonadota bacterium]|nr:MAG: PAS domain-containing protein [Gemmatimonadota bacterium]
MDSQYRQYFENMPCYLTVQDREFRIIDANARFRKDFGEHRNRCCYQVYKRRSDRCEVCPVARTFRDGERHESEEQVRTLDGVDLCVIVNTTPIRSASGEIMSVMEMSTDITHIKNLELLLRRSERRYHLLFDEVPCYISIQDMDLNIVNANRAFQDAFGNSLGRKCFEAYKHRTEPCVPCPVQETFDDGKPHTREELVTSRDGKPMNMLVTTAPIRDGSGEMTGVMEMSADITQIRELEDRLTSLGLLIGSVSHGLKGMLNGLAGGMYLVDTGFQKDDHERVLKGWDTVKRNVARIRNMVSDILYYAKDRVPNWEPLSAVDLTTDVCSLAEARAREFNVPLATDLDPSAGEFEADPQAIRSMLVNLIENSLDACRLDDKKSTHRVDVRVRGSSSHVEIEVEDNGIGMDQETREKAFSLFFSSKGTEGTGLGLFVSNRIAQAHGGTIELNSQEGVGTRFTVQIPRRRPQQEAPENPDRSAKEVLHA